MALVGITEAGKLTGRSRATIYRYLKDSRLSSSSGPSGETLIDTAELLRVFGAFPSRDTSDERINDPLRDGSETKESVAVLRAKLAAAEDILKLKDELLSMKDQVIAQLERTVLLLEDRRASAPSFQPSAESPQEPAQPLTKKQKRQASLLGGKKTSKK